MMTHNVSNTGCLASNRWVYAVGRPFHQDKLQVIGDSRQPSSFMNYHQSPRTSGDAGPGSCPAAEMAKTRVPSPAVP